MIDLELYLNKISSANNLQELEQLKVELLGKKGLISLAMKDLSNLSVEEKKQQGSVLNKIKTQISENIAEAKEKLEEQKLQEEMLKEKIDVTLDGRSYQSGSLHLLTNVANQIVSILSSMGFAYSRGPDIESQETNFSNLNIPSNHPARSDHDTFYMKEKYSLNEESLNYVLRTHTSTVQVRYMQNNKPPFKVMSLGKTYRSDHDATHSPMFHQVEGFYVAEDVSLANLKYVLQEFCTKFFGVDDLPFRFRPSYFPFTEPSFEVDISYKKTKDGIEIGKGDNWLEILGCGMVHPKVLENCSIDSKKYSGFAFGVGVERLAMLKYNVKDLRSLYANDIDFLKHHKSKNYKTPSLTKGLD